MTFSIHEDAPSPKPRRIAFDSFEVDLRSGEIRKNGSRIRLQAQPFQLLAILLGNAGEVVTREEICRELWPANTFVDFEHSLAAAVSKIREALGDTAENPKYIETLPKRGYRFIGKIKPEALVEMRLPEAQQSVELVPAVVAKPGTGRKWILGVISAAVLAGIAVSAIWLRERADSTASSEPMTIVPFTSAPGIETAPAFSPDGTRISFIWNKGGGGGAERLGYDLYVKAIGSETVLRLTNHPANWISAAWSPDGTQVAFHRLASDDNGIYVVPALGGPERKLLATHTPYPAAAAISWSPDGKWLAYTDTENGQPGDRNFLLNIDTLESREFPHDPSCIHEANLMFSHSGQELAIVCVHSMTSFEYLVTDTQGKFRRSLSTLHELPHGIAWSGDDKSLIATGSDSKNDNLCAIRVSDGEVQTLSVSGAWPTISREGHKLAVSQGESRVNVWRRNLQDSEAPPLQMLVSTRQQHHAEYSPDGKHVAFDSARSGTWSVWMTDAEGGNPVQISHEGPAGFPSWSPDSQKITFEMTEAGGLTAIYTADIADRVAHKLKTNVQVADHPYWSHDGKWLYLRGYNSAGHQLYRCPVGGGDATPLAGSQDQITPIESYDGKRLYFSSRAVNASIMTLALDHSEAAPQEVSGMPRISTESQWTLVRDGIYFTPHDSPRSICFFDFATRHTREIFKADKNLAEGISVSPDGRYLLYAQVDENDANIMLMTNFR